MRPVVPLLIALASLAAGGCTRDTRRARHLAAADAYFAGHHYAAAEIEYLNVLQLAPGNPHALARLGEVCLTEGRLGQALPYLLRTREFAPTDVDSRLRLAFALFAAGRLDDAQAEVDFVLKHRTTDMEGALLLVETSTTPAALEAVRRRLEPLHTRDPQNAPILLALGALAFRQNRPDDAGKLLGQAAALAPEQPAVHAALGTLCRARGDLAGARAHFAQAARCAPLRSRYRLQEVEFHLAQGDLGAARDALDRLAAAAPDYMPALIRRAELAAAERDYPRCEALLARALARDRAQPDALLLQARVQLAQGNLAAAARSVDTLARLYPRAAAVHYQHALVEIARHDPDAAQAALQRALSLAPNYADAILLLAEIRLGRGDTAGALGPLRSLVERRPELARARVLLVRAWRAAGDLESALDACRPLTAACPNDAAGFILTGLTLEQLRRTTEARAAFEHALALAPADAAAIEQLVGLDLAAGRTADARQRVEAALALAPRSAALHVLAAKLLLGAGNRADAERSLHTAIACEPQSATAYLLLARLSLQARRPDEAVAQLRAGIAREPNDTASAMLLAVIEHERGHTEAARACYEQILARLPRFTPALNNLACLCAENPSQLDRAYELAQRARQLSPGDPHLADTLGWVLYRRGQFVWARALLRESAARLPRDPAVLYHLGLTHYMLADPAPAREALAQALALDPAFPHRTDLVARLRLVERFLASEPTDGDEPAVADGDEIDPMALRLRGARRESAGDLAGARDAYRRALAASQGSVPLRLDLARIATLTRDRETALEYARAARRLAPNDPATAHELGRIALASGDPRWAESLLADAARDLPDDAQVQTDFAEAAYRIGRLDAAREAIRRGLTAEPAGATRDHAAAVLALLELDNPAAARRAVARIETALLAHPDCTPAAMAQAMASEAGPDSAAATRAYRALLQRYPDLAPAKRRLFLLLADDPAADASLVALGRQAHAAFPDDARLTKSLGKLLYRRGEFARAAEFLNASARVLTDDAELFFYRGMTEAALQRSDDSRTSLQRALELDLRADLAAEARRAIAEFGRKTPTPL
ncbi:MAG TPA: tetratricopeptide repeat protein [Opitutus sp.]|nr:tetratricopeptide repeat protein [Opitutus sp.]